GFRGELRIPVGGLPEVRLVAAHDTVVCQQFSKDQTGEAHADIGKESAAIRLSCRGDDSGCGEGGTGVCFGHDLNRSLLVGELTRGLTRLTPPARRGYLFFACFRAGRRFGARARNFFSEADKTGVTGRR